MHARPNIAARAARWSTTHRRLAICGWLAFVVLSVAIGGAVGERTLSDSEATPGESGRAEAALERARLDPNDEVVLLQSANQTVADPGFRAAIAETTHRLAGLPSVTHLSSPASGGGAVSADGRTLLTSIGIFESGVWLHGPGGDRLISPEGYASDLSFSIDATRLYYVLRRTRTSSPELWTTDLRTGSSTPIVQGHVVGSYDVSTDGSEVVFSARDSDGTVRLWTASADGGSMPVELAATGADSPFFDAHGDVVVRQSDGGQNYLTVIARDGSASRRVLLGPIVELKGMSPDRRWAVAMVPVNEVPSTAVVAVSLDTGATTRICPAECMARWSPDGTRFYVEPFLQGDDGGRTAAMPVPAGSVLPALPSRGILRAADASAIAGSVIVDLSTYDPTRVGTVVAPGLSPDSFAFTRTTSHRNIFQVRLP